MILSDNNSTQTIPLQNGTEIPVEIHRISTSETTLKNTEQFIDQKNNETGHHHEAESNPPSAMSVSTGTTNCYSHFETPYMVFE